MNQAEADLCLKNSLLGFIGKYSVEIATGERNDLLYLLWKDDICEESISLAPSSLLLF